MSMISFWLDNFLALIDYLTVFLLQPPFVYILAVLIILFLVDCLKAVIR